MPLDNVWEWSTTAGSNTDVGGVNIDEGMTPGDVNNAIREMMSQLREQLPRRNLAATTNPAATDDSDEGYGVGSDWVNTSTDVIWFCVDATVDAAVWVRKGAVLQSVRSETATYSSTTSTIPTDDTIPQNTEGLEVLTRAITPLLASSTLEIEASLMVSGNAALSHTAAIFVDTTASAISARSAHQQANNTVHNIQFKHRVSAASTTARTYKLRWGPNASTGYINGNSAARLYGGIVTSFLSVTEFA